MKSLPVMMAVVAMATAPGAAAESDDFERASLGPNWTRLGNSTAEIVNGSDLGTPTSTVNPFVGWTATAFGGDQYCEAVLASAWPSNMLAQVFVRKQNNVPSGTGARYAFHYNRDPGKAWWEIKYDGVVSADTRILALSVPHCRHGARRRCQPAPSNPQIGQAPGEVPRQETTLASHSVTGGVTAPPYKGVY